MNSVTQSGQLDMPQEQTRDDKSQLWRLAEQPIAGASMPDYETLRQLLGQSVCRRMGIFELPPAFVLSVVIPIYNEIKTIEEVVCKVRGAGVPVEMVLVDDGSVDGTRDLLSLARPARHEDHFPCGQSRKRRGPAHGICRSDRDVVIVQDADLEYDPAEFVKLIQPIVENQADVVFGSRFSGDNQRVLYFWHYVGNRVLTLLSNMMTNLNLSDMETCYKAFRREVIQKIAPTLRENRFGIEPELTAKIASIPRSASTNGRSATPAARTPKARRSPGATASALIASFATRAALANKFCAAFLSGTFASRSALAAVECFAPRALIPRVPPRPQDKDAWMGNRAR